MVMDLELPSEDRRLQFLWKAGNLYAEKMPEMSRFFVSKFASYNQEQTSLEALRSQVAHQHCQYCHSILLPHNHTSSVKPKPKLGRRLRALKRRQSRQQLLSNNERKLMRQWDNAANKMKILCGVCKKISWIPCAVRQQPPNCVPNREQRRLSIGTCTDYDSPQSSKSYTSTPATPFSHWSNSSKTPASSTPHRYGTPSSVTPKADSSSGRKTKKSKRDKHRQLQKLLASGRKDQEQSSPSSTKSSLSAFLTSL